MSSTRRIFLALFLVLCCRAVEIALIHDDELDLLQPTKHLELWIAQMMEDANSLNCPASIQFTVITTSPDEEFRFEQHLNKDIHAQAREFDSFVVVVTKCQTAIDSILPSSTAFLILEFISCPVMTEGQDAERLELYRLSEIDRYSCGSLAVNKWLEQRICSSTLDSLTERLLRGNKAPISLNRELQACTDLDGQSKQTAIKSSRNVDWHRQLNGNHIRLTSYEDPPFVIFGRDSNGTVVGYQGFIYEIFHALRELYNFTYEVTLPGVGTYGKETSDGTWDGMMGLIVNQRVDIGVGPFSITHSRAKAVDFSVGFYEDAAAILIPPPAEENRLLACTKPFRLEVWIVLALIVVILPAILWQHFKYTRIIGHHQHERRNPILAEQYSFIFGVLIGQSGQKLSAAGTSPRLLGAVWCLSAVVFASAYVGVLVSFLRFPKLSPVIDQLEELPGNHLKWVVQRGTALESLFVKATTGVYKTIGEGLLETPGSFVESRVAGVHRVTEGGHVYIEEKTLLESDIYEDYVRSGVCRLSIAKKEFFKVNFAFPLPIGSPLKPLLNQKILQMVEAGLVNYWKKLYWPKWDSRCTDAAVEQSAAGPKSLRLADLQGAFLILSIGWALAFLTFLAERFYFHF